MIKDSLFFETNESKIMIWWKGSDRKYDNLLSLDKSEYFARVVGFC